MDLLESAARACHDAYRAERAGGKLHAPEECPCREGHVVSPRGWICHRCGIDAERHPDCLACRPLLRLFDSLTEAQRETFRSQARPVLAVVEPMLAQARAREEARCNRCLRVRP